jgi:hypothetical protein
MRSGELEVAINRYKYAEAKGWAWIFGRVLAGYLEQIDFQAGTSSFRCPPTSARAAAAGTTLT